jgi:hypothetical protein
MRSFVEAPISLAAACDTLVMGNSNICFSCVAVRYKVKCSDDTMLVEVVMADSTSDIYLKQLKHYPGK